ncbi:MAG: hypothetical protein K1X74_00850 [Pirellulales bacterium]|nr:hypothetical protein [Pirellulales bacterium]
MARYLSRCGVTVCWSLIMLQSALALGSPADGGLDGQEIVNNLAARCRPWIQQPSRDLKSLRYVYHLGNDDRIVELVSGGSKHRASMWQGATLLTGLTRVLRAPNQFDVEVERVDGQPQGAEPHLELTVRPKAAVAPFHLEVGHGIDGEWHGYFCHSSSELRLELDSQTLLPRREVHDDSQYEFLSWREVGADRWVPQLIVVHRGDIVFRMHFAWQGNAAWLLESAESVKDGRVTLVARTSDVQINDDRVVAKHSEGERRQNEGRRILRQMLEKNAAWLAPAAAFDTLEYEFHVERDDVTETCVFRRDGLVVFEASPSGERRIVLPDGRTGQAHRNDPRAFVHAALADSRNPEADTRLRRNALMGCRFDLPLFELGRMLDDCRVEIADGQWNGTPCHVATISSHPRSARLGCGVMLGFSSRCYLHDLRPAYEVLYIDKQRLVPLHETLVCDRDDRRFEIDFAGYTPVAGEAGSLVPLGIDVESKDYFACHYDFQLVAGRQWLLKTVAASFSSGEQVRGTVNVARIDGKSTLADDVERQVQAYREVFEADARGDNTVTQTVNTLTFRLGRQMTIGPASAAFTLDAQRNLILRCKAERKGVTAGQTVRVLLLDADDRLLQAAQGVFADENDQFTAVASFGRSRALSAVARFVIDGLGDTSQLPDAELRRLAACRPVVGAGAVPLRAVADASGETRLVDVALQTERDGGLVAAVHFASRDRMNEFVFETSVAVFDPAGRLLSAGAKSDKVKVVDYLVDATWGVALPRPFGDDRVSTVAIGLSRGDTTSAPVGTLWGMLDDRGLVFPLETLLAADDPGCWRAALQEIDSQLVETLDDGLFNTPGRWRRQTVEHEAPVDLLQPYADRLLEIVDRAREPAMLATAIRLLGFANDQRVAAPSLRLLEHEDANVRAAAGIALCLLRRDEGLGQIEAMLTRQESAADDPGRFAQIAVAGQALVALATVRSDASVRLVQGMMNAYIDGATVVQSEHSRELAGTGHRAEQLATLLGNLQDARNVQILTDAIDRLEARRDFDGYREVHGYLTAILGYDDAAFDFIDRRVRRGDIDTIYALAHTSRADFVPAVRVLLESQASADVWHDAIRYLRNLESPDAVDVLREAYGREIPEVSNRKSNRLRLAAALAFRGDERGFPAALEELAKLADPGQGPGDEQARKQWKQQVDDRRSEALEVFDRAGTRAVVELVARHAGDESPNTQLALLQILAPLRALPDALRPQVEKWARSSSEQVSEQAQRLLRAE